MYVHDSSLSQFVREGMHAGNLTRPSRCPIGSERRQHWRFPVYEKAHMHTVYPVSSKRRAVTVLDLSSGGLKVQAAMPELVGSSVRVHFKDLFVIGEVRYCVEVGELCHIGIRVEAVLYGYASNSSTGIVVTPGVRGAAM